MSGGHTCPWCHAGFTTDRGLDYHLRRCSQGAPCPPRDLNRTYNHCPVCSLRHTPRCKPERRWPVEPLEALIGDVCPKERERLTGTSGATWERFRVSGLDDWQADRYAIRLGYHPAQIWPDWTEAGLSAVDRQFLAGGWRQAWEWAEPITDSDYLTGAA